jgi:hypothetical protein
MITHVAAFYLLAQQPEVSETMPQTRLKKAT